MPRPDPIARHRSYLTSEHTRLMAEWTGCADPEVREDIEAELDAVDDALASLDLCFA